MPNNYYLDHIDGFGQKVTALRKQQGMISSHFAKKVGVAPNTLSQWEKDETMPTWNSVVKLAKACGITAKDLVGEDTVKQLAAHKRELAKKNSTRGYYFGYIEGLGDRIYHLRKKAGLTQKQLAKKAGLSYRAISTYELDRVSPSSKAAQKLADALDVTLEELLGKDVLHAENHGNHD